MSKTLPIALAADDGVAEEKLKALREQTNLPIVSLDRQDVHLLLVQTTRRLELRQIGKGAPGAVYAEFVGGKAARRRREGAGRKQPIAKAVGLKAGKIPSIIDATAGLGQDALMLATLGCQVTLIERSPLVSALLEDALKRAQADTETAEIAARMQLIEADACDHLNILAESQRPDVIFLDPMFPKRSKSALVKKEMRLFQLLPGVSNDTSDLLPLSLSVARQRVVVKRPAKAPWLTDIEPTMAIHSQRIRFDVYLNIRGS